MNIKTSRKYCRDRQTGIHIYKDRTTVSVKNERCFHLRELSCWRSNRFQSESRKSRLQINGKKKEHTKKRILNLKYSTTLAAKAAGMRVRVKCIHEASYARVSRNRLAQPALSSSFLYFLSRVYFIRDVHFEQYIRYTHDICAFTKRCIVILYGVFTMYLKCINRINTHSTNHCVCTFHAL